MQVLCYLPSKSHILLESQGSHTEQPQHRVSFSPFHWPGLSQKVSLKRAQHPGLWCWHHHILLEPWGWLISYTHVITDLHLLSTARCSPFPNIPHLTLPGDLLAAAPPVHDTSNHCSRCEVCSFPQMLTLRAA